MRIIPSIDLDGGRSRIVFWPGASTGIGAPTDQPARIARHFVDRGATLIHLVDFDGARAGAPVNLAAIGAVAGGQTSPHGVLSIACGVALRVVLGIILFGIALLPAVIATKCAPRKARRPPNVRLSGG